MLEQREQDFAAKQLSIKKNPVFEIKALRVTSSRINRLLKGES